MVDDNLVDMRPEPYFALLAIVLGIASQYFINTMLSGDRGISAFLSDGNGFNRSGFKTIQSSKDTKKEDPLPWLKLPKLDFVEVAGQKNYVDLASVQKELNGLKARLDNEFASGQKEKATETMNELNALMEEYGFEFKGGNDNK